MPAANTDKFLKVAQNKGWQLGSGGIPDASTTSFALVSAEDIPTDTAVIVTIDRVDANKKPTPTKMERIIGVMDGDNVTACIRGVAGTAQQHNPGAVVEVVVSATNINKLIEGILAEHGQDGKHLISALDAIRYAADAGGDDTYSVTLAPAPTAYYAGMEVNFKPTTANTGACTLDVNGLGAKAIKKNVSADLETGDILAGQMVKVIYDGTNFQLVSDIPLVKASAAEIDTGTDDAKFATALAIAGSTLMKSSHARFKVNTITRDQTAASGNVAYTGVGFAPKGIILIGNIGSAVGSSIGFAVIDAGTNQGVMFRNTAGTDLNSGSFCFYRGDGASWNQSASISSMNADGFTLAWDKGGAPPAGTITMFYIAFK